MTSRAPRGAPRGSLRLLALLALVMIGCTSFDFHTAKSPTAAFDRYRTFAFDTHPAEVSFYWTSTRSADVAARIQREVTDLLQAKGYVLVPEGSADVVVRVAVGERVRERNVRGLGPSRFGWLEEDETPDILEGAFVIDAFEATTGELVYHGAAHTEIDPQRVDAANLQAAVAAVVKPFPPRPGH